MSDHNVFKKDVFNSLMEMSGRVFVAVKHSERVSIGHRGFNDDEKENGITLVFNRDMSYVWDDYGITATLSFGSVAEKCIIPASDIVAIFAPEAGVQMLIDPERFEALNNGEAPQKEPVRKKDEASSDEKVIKVDFKRRNE